ncbi:MAG: aspartyl-tRNA synthetase [Parcubacteria group bacterium Gr01-1014_3]|nr:MAG: aspartyl-tRNA synthetase [Parcubacteria group bacterium Gr01-1014_3]
MRTLIRDLVNKVGEQVEISGWVHVRRDHGKLIFIELRDRSGVVQVVFLKDLYEQADKLRPEWVVKITGQVNARPANMVNPNISTGTIEILAKEVSVYSEAKTPPIAVDTDGSEIGEEARMKYRYVDLRRARMQRNLRLRSKTLGFIDEYMKGQDFVEVETPILSKSTPEGARDYLVPSRLYPGKFYALPQSPQQYKQLLMVAGLERYFQVARCFRDEDTRGDRQPEFTQIDLEMSFVNREDVLAVLEGLMIELVTREFPEKKIQQAPFPRISYKEAMEKYGNDKPDFRKDKNDPNELAFVWVIDFPFYEEVKDPSATAAAGQAGSGQRKKWDFGHNPFSMPYGEKLPDMTNDNDYDKLKDVMAMQYDLALNGFEIAGGSIRNHLPDLLKKAFTLLGYEEKVVIDKFGHMMDAFSYGVPPHGGAAIGFDRLMMILLNEPNIREVIAFSKTGDGRDLMMDAPSDVDDKQMKELHLKITK